MVRTLTVPRAFALVALALMVCSCGVQHASTSTTSGGERSLSPSFSSVSRARFVSTVSLDNGKLLVTKPAARAKTIVEQSQAQAMFDAADAVAGTHTFAIFGLGVVTVASNLQGETPPTTVPASTVPTTTTTSTTTTTTTTTTTPSSDTSDSSTTSSTPTTDPTTTTSAPAPAETTTTSATTSTTTASSSDDTTVVSPVTNLLAWVGIVWGGVTNCPRASGEAHTAADSGYTVVIIDAASPSHVLSYASGGEPPCGGAVTAPSVSFPNELVSVAWQPVGSSSTAVTATVPACGQFYGWNTVDSASASTSSIEVIMAVPYDMNCANAAAAMQTIPSVVPLGQAAQVAHAPVGLVDALHSLSAQ